jgi:hypothetical protein
MLPSCKIPQTQKQTKEKVKASDHMVQIINNSEISKTYESTKQK